MEKHYINIEENKCIGCGLCERDCPEKNIIIEKGKAKIRSQACMKCGHCYAICPQMAVSISGYDDISIQKPSHLNAKELLTALQTRRSIRHFKNQEISDEVLQSLMEAGRYSPTAKNLQNVSYIILHKEIDTIEKLAVSFFRKLFPVAKLFTKRIRHHTIEDHFFFKEAPYVILLVSNGGFASINASLAASNISLMAEANGLGVLYSGFFTLATKYSRKLRKSLDLSKKDQVIASLVIGYPNIIYQRSVQREKALVQYK